MVRLKKYFYVLRPLLAARWINRTHGAPPIEFATLLAELEGEPSVLTATQALLRKKRSTAELGLAAAVPELNALIEAKLGDQPVAPQDKPRSADVVDALNSIFRLALQDF